MEKDVMIYLEHILDCIRKIKNYTRDMQIEQFLENELVQDAVIRNFEIIGEAAKNINTEFRSQHNNIEWKKISGMRDKLIHDYIGVDLWAVWGVVTNVIPIFEMQIKEIINIK